ncbi:peptidase A4 family-domain-containing protein [Xylaria sp. CBS 124048]|nr:peptidase A4 family-domain-containing protein [Xylaria sp. CBS 124048]
MKSVAIATVLLAAGAIAAPNTAARRAKNAARIGRRSNLRQPAINPPVNGSKNVEFSENWAGAVLSDSGFTSVTGTIIVPTPESDGQSAAASAWVGIDGDTCATAILQTGLDFTVSAGGEVSYDAWYEWFPDFAFDFDNFDISSGDEVKMTVTASSKSSGTATIENLTTGQTVSHSFSGETNELCEFDAEWIVEDFEEGSSLVPFADFDSVTFTDASAVKNGKTVGVTGAAILDIEQEEVLTDCSIEGTNSVTCSYI